MSWLEQLDWQVPDHLIVPGGNLANSSALGKGFAGDEALGLIDRLPQISVIQAEGANPLYLSWTQHGGEGICSSGGGHAGERDSDWQSGIVEEGGVVSWKARAAGASR